MRCARRSLSSAPAARATAGENENCERGGEPAPGDHSRAAAVSGGRLTIAGAIAA